MINCICYKQNRITVFDSDKLLQCHLQQHFFRSEGKCYSYQCLPFWCQNMVEKFNALMEREGGRDKGPPGRTILTNKMCVHPHSVWGYHCRLGTSMFCSTSSYRCANQFLPRFQVEYIGKTARTFGDWNKEHLRVPSHSMTIPAPWITQSNWKICP